MSLKAKKTFITIPTEYSDFANIFSKKLAAILPEYIEINIYAIDLEKSE